MLQCTVCRVIPVILTSWQSRFRLFCSSLLNFGKREADLPAKPAAQRKPGTGHRKALRLLVMVLLLIVVKLFQLDWCVSGWLDDYNRQFHQPAPEAIPQGTVCNLLIQLEEEGAILLESSEDRTLDQLDTLILHGLILDSIDGQDTLLGSFLAALRD